MVLTDFYVLVGIVGLCVLSTTLSITAFIMGVIAFIELKSFNKSTHNVQYMPIDLSNPLQKEDLANLSKIGQDPFLDEESENSWATSEKSINKQNKMYREELEEKMPEFLSNTDEKPYSF